MTNHGEVTRIEIYWDNQDPSNEGWAARWERQGVGEESGPIDGIADDDDLDGAIAEACYQLGVSLRADQFARESHIDGGFAIWSRV